MATVPSHLDSSTLPAIKLWPQEAADSVSIPTSANTLSGFREWALSDDFPKRGKITFVAGGLIVDMSPANLETHGDPKSELSRVLANLVREQRVGRLYIDDTLVSNKEAGVSNEPDILYLSKATLNSGLASLTPAKERPETHKEVVGTVDWVLEIVSPSSIKKDKVLLREAYFRAGIPEYWIVDVRGEEIEFDVLVPGDEEYVAVESRDGWYRSPTFDREFRLDREKEADGYWLYTLHCREKK